MNQPSLQAVYQQFIEWRKQKKSPREKIPTSLWKSTIQLIPKYSMTKVTRTLKISPISLKQKIKESPSSINQPSKEVGFVEVKRSLNGSPLLNVPSSQSSLYCDRVEIQRKDGSRLTLYSQEGNTLDGKQVIRAFLGEDHASNCSTN